MHGIALSHQVMKKVSHSISMLLLNDQVPAHSIYYSNRLL